MRIFNDDTAPTGATGLINGQSGVDHPGGWGTIMIMPLRFGGGAIDVTADFNGDGTITTRQFRSGYYCFDITDPEKPPKLLWRFTHGDLGFSTSYPAIARVDTSAPNTGKWFMVVGSGPKNQTGGGNRDYAVSTTTNPGKLFVVNLTDGTLATTSPITLLSSDAVVGDPTVVDGDLDYNSDVIYVGTAWQNIGGRVFRINITGTDPNNWTKSTLFDVDPSPSADDPDPDNNEEMGVLLTPPGVSKDLAGNLWVFFGTGRLFNTSDMNTDHRQRFYGIKDGCWEGLSKTTCTDSSKGGASGNDHDYSLSDLFNSKSVAIRDSKNSADQVVDLTVGQTVCGAEACSYAELMNVVSSYKGWYRDLNSGSGPSERVLARPSVLGGLVLFTSYEPASSVCSVLGKSRLYAIYYETGTPYIESVVGTYTQEETFTAEDGTLTTEDVEYVADTVDLGVGMPTAVGVAIGENVTGFVQKSTGEIVRINAAPGLGVRSGFDSWRESPSSGGGVEVETIYKHIVK